MSNISEYRFFFSERNINIKRNLLYQELTAWMQHSITMVYLLSDASTKSKLGQMSYIL